MNSRSLLRTLRLCVLPILSLTATLNAADTDSDGLDDSVETNTGVYVSASNTGTNPNNADTDFDGSRDGWEVNHGANPCSTASFPAPAHARSGVKKFTDLRSSGIAASKTYTHAISGGSPVVVNGVSFVELSATATPANFTWEAGQYKNQLRSTDSNPYNQWNPDSAGVTDPGLRTLLGSFAYATHPMWSGPGKIQRYTLSGLTPGVNYEVRLYTRVWDKSSGVKPIDITFTNGSEMVQPWGALPQERPDFVLGNSDRNSAFYLSFAYCAQTDRLVIDTKVPQSADTSSPSWHLYGLTNEVQVDSDSDGLSDLIETNTGIFVSADNTGTNPNNADTDADGIPDGLEAKEKTSPVDATKFNSYSKGLMAYYPLSGDCNDWTGSAYNGSLFNASWSKSDGKTVLNAISESPGGMWIRGAGNRQFPSSGWTISGWIKAANFTAAPAPNGYYTLFETGGISGSQQSAIRIGYSAHGLVVEISGLDDYPINAQFFYGKFFKTSDFVGDTLLPGMWNHICVTVDGSNVTGYVNGKLLASSIGGTWQGQAPKITSRDVGIGMLGSKSDLGNSSLIRDLRIYLRGISSSEIESLFQEELSRIQIIQGSYTWRAAKSDAEVRGGRLAVLSTQEKISQAAAQLIAEGSWNDMWLGLTDDSQEGVWRWIDGNLLSANSWSPGEPNNIDGADHAYIWASSVFAQPKWDDGVETAFKAYLLELPPTSQSLSVLIASNGVITGAGSYYSGSSATITAMPDPGYIFAGWTGDASGTTNPLNITMDADKTVGATFRLAGTDSNLSNLVLGSSTLAPSFSPATSTYTASVPNATSSITVTPTLSDTNAKVKVNGALVASGSASAAIQLAVGSNTITVLATAEDGSTTSTYTVIVTRISNVATLSSLALSSGALSPTFASATKTYTASVSNVTTSMTVTPTVTDSTSTVKVNGTTVGSGSASQSIPLVVGPNIITTLVTAQDGTTTSTYTLTVTRAPSAVSSLSALALSEGTLSPVFASGTYTYSASMPNLTTTLQVTPTVTDATATVKVNGVTVASGSASASIPLIVGANTITVQSTAQDGTTRSTYTINVSRAPSAVCSLASLTSNRGPLSPAFDSTTAAYDITVLNAVTSIQVTPTVTDPTASVKVNGATVASGAASASIPLIEGNNTITILVTAQDGTTTATYSVTAKRLPPSTVATLSALEISSGSLTPQFDPAVTSYAVTCQNAISTITVQPTAADSTATVRVNGQVAAGGGPGVPVDLNVGITPITISVLAEDGTSARNYILSVTRLPLVFAYTADNQIPVEVAAYPASGSLDLSLGYAPSVGTRLMVVNVTGLDFISGRFSNLAHGQAITLPYGGRNYHFIANYYGGTGNDLTLEWPYTWTAATGSNGSGQLGDNSTTDRSSPVEVSRSGVLAGKTILAMAAGSSHSMALCSDGTLASWGSNVSGQLGIGNNTDSAIPSAVSKAGVLSGRTIVSIACGGSHSLALCSDGVIAAWGLNSSGQMGNTSRVSYTTPDAVIQSEAFAGKKAVAIAAGLNHSLALYSDGTIAAWGANASGQLGNGTTTDSEAPVAVLTDGVLSGKTVIAIAAGTSHSLALCSDGTLAAWGANGFGQLGDNTWTSRSSPVAVLQGGVLADRVVTSITSGAYHNLALCSDGFIASWGYNASGQLGNGNLIESNIPLPVTRTGLLANKKSISIAAGANHSLALCNDGSVAAWGANGSGQIGSGSTTDSKEPVAMTSTGLLAGQPVSQLVAGKIHTLLVTTVSNSTELLSLTPSTGNLSPSFDPLKVNYTINVAHSTTALTVSPVTLARNSTVKVNGIPANSGSTSQSVPLTVGPNLIKTLVTAQDGVTTRTYTVTVNRAPSSTATLSNLSLSSGSLTPTFTAERTTYTVSVVNSVTSVKVSPVLTDLTAKVKINGASVTSGGVSASIPLKVGSNTITALVTAQNGTTTKTYTIKVTRAESSDASLSGLVVNAATLSPKFKATTTSYTAAVTKSVSSVKIRPTSNHGKASIKVNGKEVKSGSLSAAIPLEIGKNTIKVEVTAEDGTSKTYKITLTRGAALKSAVALGLNPEAVVPPESQKSKVTVDGQRYLQLTLLKPTPGFDGVVEVSPDLVNWFSGKHHTTVMIDDDRTLTVRDKTPIKPGTKRFIRVRP